MSEGSSRKIRLRRHFERVKSWYERFERPISSLSLIGGFAFDALTLTRVDEAWENFWVVVHLAIVAVFIVLVNLGEDRETGTPEEEEARAKRHFWYVNVLQFFFGGILSTYLVFYFRSGSIATSWPFFIILAAAFIANESLKKQYTRLTFQISLFFLSIYAFAIYLLPILFHTLGPAIFVASGLASLVFIVFFLGLIRPAAKRKFRESAPGLTLAISLIFIAMNALYFLNLIPPIPLSLKASGIYHSLVVLSPGNYLVKAESEGPFSFFKFSEDIYLEPGEPLYAYSAIFSPDAFNTDIIHEWQEWDPATGAWITKNRITLPVTGGRDGGYRTFSTEAASNLSPGEWRVNVLTARGAVIGSMRFNAITTSTPPAITEKVLD